jgi:uncharacterized protein
MSRNPLVSKARKELRDSHVGEASSRRWRQAERVRSLALRLARSEGADESIVQLAVLLRGFSRRDSGGVERSLDGSAASEWLRENHVGERLIHGVTVAIRAADSVLSGVVMGERSEGPSSLEAAVVMDAERLDAMGSIGIKSARLSRGCSAELSLASARGSARSSSTPDFLDDAGMRTTTIAGTLAQLRDAVKTPSGKRIACGRHELLLAFRRAPTETGHSSPEKSPSTANQRVPTRALGVTRG